MRKKFEEFFDYLTTVFDKLTVQILEPKSIIRKFFCCSDDVKNAEELYIFDSSLHSRVDQTCLK